MKFFALLVAKLSGSLLQMIHRGGSFPGSLALKICPHIFDKLKYDSKIILVTGTNGKTSTSNLISDTFVADGKRVINNRKGDNLKEGIASALLAHANLRGKIKADVMVLEVDELNIPYIMKHLRVHTLIVTNFFRDQLDRSKEMEQLIQKIEGAITQFTGTLVLNGNDPNVVRLQDAAKDATKKFFGTDECSTSTTTSQEASEGKFCPRCNNTLTYTYYQYSHIGVFHCSHCDFKTPHIEYKAENIDIQTGSFTYDRSIFTAPINSLYTIYNCMAVLAIARSNKIADTIVNLVFTNAVQPEGRNETFKYQNQNYTLNLIKNPTGANEVLKTIALDQEHKILMIVLNDNPQDGTDVSWIYDAQFERVLALSTDAIICSGTRAYDMALRIKYSDFKGDIIICDTMKDGLDKMYACKCRGYVIATYTALHTVRNLMRRDS